MSSQKKSSTKVRAKNAAPTGQRQYSNLLRSKKVVVVEAKIKPRKQQIVVQERKFQGPSQKAPVSTASRLKAGPPKSKSIANGGINVVHVELIGTVFKPLTGGGYPDSPSALHQTHRLRINPGSKSTFNWLSTLAANYEFFRFRRITIHYETRCGTSERGSLIMSPDYDAADGQIPVSEQSLFSNRGTVDDTIWKHLDLKLDVSAMNRLYKSHPNMSDERFATSAQDEKTIDPAQVFVLVDSDVAAATKYGKIFVSYDVDLTDPQNPTEPPNLGGAFFGSNSLTNNSTLPIPGVPNLASFGIDNNIFTPVTALPTVITSFPTATVGRFSKPYEGIAIVNATGTGIAGNSLVYVSDDATSPAGSVGDILTTFVSAAINSTATQGLTNRIINAAEGQFLKIITPNAATLTQYVLDIAGSSSIL